MMSLNPDKIKKRAVSSSYLKNRINFNKKYQKSNFSEWQFKTYKKMISKSLNKKKLTNIKILDVGSGDGLQVSYFAKIFKNPEIWCIDYSKKSLISIRRKFKSKKIKLFKLDMDNLQKFIEHKKLRNYFDIAHSSYALYYARHQIRVLNTMKNSLVKDGFFLISAPSEPHEMVNFINSIYRIPNKIIKTLKFYKNILLPYLKRNGSKNIFERKINSLSFNKKSEFLEFWKNTTYYNKKIENKVINKLKNRKSLYFKKISTIVCSVKK